MYDWINNDNDTIKHTQNTQHYQNATVNVRRIKIPKEFTTLILSIYFDKNWTFHPHINHITNK